MRELIAAYLLNAAWQVPLVAFCAWTLCRFAALGPAAAARLWLAFLAGAAVLPAVALQTLLPQATPTVARAAPEALFSTSAQTLIPATARTAEALRLEPGLALFMLALCAAVALVIAARLAIASVAARRLVRRASPAQVPAEALEAVARLARRHDREAPRILRSAEVASPAVVGVLKPVILIPHDLAATGEELSAALLHETAHIVRHDYAANLACELLTLPLAWHPALMALKTGVRRSREIACDAIAASAMASDAAYAKCLVSLARRLAPDTGARLPGARTALAVGLFGRSDLEERLMRLMNAREAESPLLRATRLSGLAAIGVGVLGSAALLHVTPVFAKAQAAPVAAAPAAPNSVTIISGQAASAAAQADRDAAKAAVAPHHRRSSMIFSQDGVILRSGEAGYAHSWTSQGGRTMTVYTDDPKAPTDAQERAWEKAADEAEIKAQEVEKRINSPEFKAKIAAAQAQAERARAMVDSPAFKARLAEAARRAEEARKLVDSPEFKARIARAEASARAAEARVNSPEFRAQLEHAQAAAQLAAQRLQRELDRMHEEDGVTPSKPAP